MISGQRTIALGRALVPGEVLEVLPEDLRTFVARDTQVDEIFLRAFMLRRLMLITRQLGNVVVLGSRHSTNTMCLREFLRRNGHPYTYVDLDTDAASEALLDRDRLSPFGIQTATAGCCRRLPNVFPGVFLATRAMGPPTSWQGR